MTRGLALLRAARLHDETRCPSCGARRSEMIGAKQSPIAVCIYSCSAEFQVDANGEIIASTVCPTPSHVAARALNEAARAEATVKAGAA